MSSFLTNITLVSIMRRRMMKIFFCPYLEIWDKNNSALCVLCFRSHFNVSFKTICVGFLRCCQRLMKLLDICLLSLQRPLLAVYFCGVGTSCHTQYYSYITAWLTVFLSCCDQINLDGSETMNDDITIWAPATCRSKNQLVFGQD